MSDTGHKVRLDALGKALVNKGIPPFLLASNINVPEYIEVRMWKENGCILVQTTCIDEEAGQLQYTYHYDETTTLQFIVETVAGRDAILYDRQRSLNHMAEGFGFTNHLSKEMTLDEFVRTQNV